MLFLIFIVLIVCYLIFFSNSNASSTNSSVSQNTSAIKYDTNNPYDLCCALACLAGFSAIKGHDDLPSCLMVRIDREANTASIYAHGHYWVNDPHSISEYRKVGVSDSIANFLTQFAYIDEYWNKNKSLAYNFPNSINQTKVLDAINNGLDLLPYKPYDCQLKTYSMNGKPSTFCIDLWLCND